MNEGIPRAPFAAILERELLEYESQKALAQQLVAGHAFKTLDAANRRLYSILTGRYVDKQGRIKVQVKVTFDLADRILTALDLNDLWHTELAEWYGEAPDPEPLPPRKRYKRHPRLPEPFLRKSHELHLHHYVSLNAICRATHARFGFRTPKDMTGPLSRSWQALGLHARDRIEMTRVASTKHGLSPRDWKKRKARRKAAGWGAAGGKVDIKGKPLAPRCLHDGCTKGAAHGGIYCYIHDPANREKIESDLARMRARSPKQDPANLVPVDDLAESLRVWFEWNGGRWNRLDKATGIDKSQLRRYSLGKPSRITRQQAERIRIGLEEVAA